MKIKLLCFSLFGLAQIALGQKSWENVESNRLAKNFYLDKSDFKLPLDSLVNQKIPGYNKLSGFKLLLYKGAPVIIENGSGRIYASTFNFNSLQRLDSTIHSGYCYGASILIYKDTIFSIGGYGFWKLNGTLRYFDQSTSEWSFFPTDREIPFADGVNSFSYYNHTKGILYLLYEDNSSETVYPSGSTKNKGVKIAKLNLRDKIWGSFEGNLDSKWANHISDLSDIINGPQGLILNSKKFRSLLYLDFEENTVYKLPQEFRIKKIQLSNSLANYITFWEKDSLVLYNYTNHNIAKIHLEKKERIGPVFSEINNSSIVSFQHKWIDYALICSLFVAVFIIVKARYKKESIQVTSSKTVDKVYSSKEFFQLLNHDEKAILSLILNNSIKDKKTTIDEINKAMGIQSRPYKIQNNMRAEVISKINKTYAAFNEIGDEIIVRNQAAFDKRFKEYQINNRYLKKLNELTGRLNM
jgi:hypothetical protein